MSDSFNTGAPKYSKATLGVGSATAAALVVIGYMTITSYISFDQISTPDTPAAGKVLLYAKSDDKLYIKNDSGTETEVGAGGTELPTLTDGQLFVGDTGADPVAANIIGTANRITVTNGAGTITLTTPQDTHTAATPTFGSLTLGTPLSVGNGGTGAATAGNARTALGLGTLATQSTVTLTTDVTGALPVANGGTASTTAETARTALGIGSMAFYGDGGEGDLVFDGADGVTVAGATESGNVYTMTRDIYANDISVSTSVFIYASSYRIFCNGTLTLTGTAMIHCNGGSTNTNAAGTAGGAANVLGSGTAGGAGGSAAGSAGTNATNAAGGAGGAGGLGSGGAGGAAGSATRTAADSGGFAICRIYPYCVTGLIHGSTTKIAGGAGGGGGGGDGTNAGGGGGGGGCLVVCANIIAGTGTICARGGNGASPGAGNRGGGGGGGGGWVCVMSNTIAGTITIDAAGGTGGTKQGTGVNGTNGSAGTAVILLGHQ